jgi:5-hydroxyisourate hydrolase
MATVSSHTLNGVDGTHAGGINVSLYQLSGSGIRTVIFDTETDPGGRLREEIEPGRIDTEATYELVFETGPYWTARKDGPAAGRYIRQIVLRFEMPDSGGLYHMPVILGPNTYSTWSSS